MLMFMFMLVSPDSKSVCSAVLYVLRMSETYHHFEIDKLLLISFGETGLSYCLVSNVFICAFVLLDNVFILLCTRDLTDLECFIKVIEGCQQLDKETKFVNVCYN